MTKEEYLQSTINYYSEDTVYRRCQNLITGKCCYSPEHANKLQSEGCAIGRYLTSEDEKGTWDNVNLTLEELVNSTDRNKYMPPWMRDMPIEYLTAIQSLHDRDENWNLTGLSITGKITVNNIINKYELNLPKY